MSTSKWCRYSVKLIANTLCPEDRKNGILPDMVIPIFPNTQCSSDTRPVIRPLQNFPFPNCFHWLESLSYIRMRRHSPFVDDSRAIRLDSEQNHATSWTFRQDFDRMAAVLSQGEPDGSSSSSPTPEDEFMNASMRGFGGRQFLDVFTIRQMFVMRDEQGKSAGEIEKALGLRQGGVERLGAPGVAELAREATERGKVDMV